MTGKHVPEMVGATEQPIVLAGHPATARVATERPSGPVRELAQAAPQDVRTHINVENITGSGAPVAYSVYVNLPHGENPTAHPELFAGLLPMFGVSEASRSGGTHAGSGLRYSLDITEAVRVLSAAGRWDPRDIRLTFVPEAAGSDQEFLAEAAANPVRVGRISVYVE